MSLFTFASSADTASLLQSIVSIATALAWPVLGVSIIAVLGFLFKPLLRGVWRVMLLQVKPRRTLEQRIADNKVLGREQVRRFASDHEGSHPNLAAELRLLAGSN
ncbi:hypothetical protein [Glaciimonas sp. PCH181]|uniref:hypothetical protein n=1 Tax=Glaciimonas sp. PCH181 TaxID=2133943 RepID=UPI000D380D2D|nr:hypothetical protein [Glaciimonas sp. PCH181]PUA17922.1 hypothetical protein C7W93_18910 [Glaciimonas sp. PCH181]